MFARQGLPVKEGSTWAYFMEVALKYGAVPFRSKALTYHSIQILVLIPEVPKLFFFLGSSRKISERKEQRINVLNLTREDRLSCSAYPALPHTPFFKQSFPRTVFLILAAPFLLHLKKCVCVCMVLYRDRGHVTFAIQVMKGFVS